MSSTVIDIQKASTSHTIEIRTRRLNSPRDSRLMTIRRTHTRRMGDIKIMLLCGMQPYSNKVDKAKANLPDPQEFPEVSVYHHSLYSL